MTRFNTSTLTLILCFFGSGLVRAGELDPQQQEWHQNYKQQPNAPNPEEMLLNTDAEPDVADGFTSLFNGKDLTGWTPKGGICTFEVRDGLLVGTCIAGSDSTYLSTEKADFTNFVFCCDMKWEVDCNSGVMFRAQSKPGKNETETVYGPQAEMEGFSTERHWSGGIYGQSCGGYFYPLWLKEHEEARAATKKGEWNRLTISAQGNIVKTWINGVPVSHWIDDGTYPKGFFGLQIHKGVKGTVVWKNIRVKKLPDSAADYRGRDADAMWRKEALARIEKIRKADLTIEVVDADGKPLKDAIVKVQMQRHAFGFGTAVNAMLPGGTESDFPITRKRRADVSWQDATGGIFGGIRQLCRNRTPTAIE